MTTFSIRGIDDHMAELLKQEAKRRGISMNTLILELLRHQVGLRSDDTRHPSYHDLDHLAGTWTPEEVAEFIETQQDFEQIDKDLWQ